MVDVLGNLNLTLSSIATWLMTLVLILLAATTIIGFLMFIGNRKLNKAMFLGFSLFIVCTLIFTRVFGYRMEFFNASVSQIGLYTLYYLMYVFKGVPVQPPPDESSLLLLFCTVLSL